MALERPAALHQAEKLLRLGRLHAIAKLRRERDDAAGALEIVVRMGRDLAHRVSRLVRVQVS